MQCTSLLIQQRYTQCPWVDRQVFPSRRNIQYNIRQGHARCYLFPALGRNKPPVLHGSNTIETLVKPHLSKLLSMTQRDDTSAVYLNCLVATHQQHHCSTTHKQYLDVTEHVGQNSNNVCAIQHF